MATLREIVTLFKFRSDKGEEKAAAGVRKVGQETDRARAKARGLGQEWAGIGTQILQVAARGIRNAAKFLVGDFASTTDAAAKTARAIGITIGSYQRLGFAAQINGANQAQLTTGLRTLAKRIRDANLGLKTAQLAFRDAGVTAADLKSKKPDEIFLRIADRFKQIEDPVKRAAVAQELFGRGGLALVNTLSSGSAEINRLGDRAARLGIVMDAQAGAKAESFQDRMLELKSAMRGIRNVLAGELIPQITKLVQRFVTWIGTGDNLRRVVNGIQTAAKAFGAVLGVLISQKIINLARMFGRAILGVGLAFRSLLISSGLGILILLIFKAWKQSSELRDAVMQIGQAFGQIASQLGPILTQIVQAFLPLVPVIAQILTLLAEIVSQVLAALGPALTDILKVFAEALKEILPVIAQILSFLVKGFGFVFKKIIIPLIKAVISVFRAIGSVVRPVITAIKDAFEGLFNFLRPAISFVGKAFKLALIPVKFIIDGIRKGVDFLISAFNKVIEFAKSIANNPVVKFLIKGGKFLGQFFGGGVSGITSKVEGLANRAIKARQTSSKTSNVSVGTVAVNVSGSANMTPDQLAAAVRQGANRAIQDVATDTLRDFRATE